jgi:hypothetical protein
LKVVYSKTVSVLKVETEVWQQDDDIDIDAI